MKNNKLADVEKGELDSEKSFGANVAGENSDIKKCDSDPIPPAEINIEENDANSIPDADIETDEEIKEAKSVKQSFAKDSTIMAAGSLISRLTGMFRSILLVWAVGATGIAADAFDVGNNIPSMLYAILSGGILDAILVPQVVRILQSKNSQKQLNKLINLAGIALFIFTFILVLCSSLFVDLISSSRWSSGQHALAVSFTLICMPQVFFYGLYTLLGQILVAKEKFAAYTWAPILNNIVACTGLSVFIFLFGRASDISSNVNDLASWTPEKIAVLAGSATLGIAAQALILIIPLKKINFKWKLEFGLHGFGLRKTTKIAIWSLAYVTIGQAVSIIATRCASSAPTFAAAGEAVAGNAAYTQALTIYIIPHALITISIATALYTKISKSASMGDLELTKRLYSKGVCTTAIFTFFSAGALFILATPVVKLLIPSISVTDCGLVGLCVSMLAFKLIPMGALVFTQRTFFAFEDTRSVFLLTIPDCTMQTLLIFATTAFAPHQYWVAGICLASSLSYILAFAVNFWGLKKHMRYRGGRKILTCYVKCGIATALSMLAGRFVYKMFNASNVISWQKSFVVIAVTGIVMLLIYLVVVKISKIEEFDDLYYSVKTKASAFIKR